MNVAQTPLTVYLGAVERTETARALHAHLVDRGCHVAWLAIPVATLPEEGNGTQGIVLIDDGTQTVADWLWTIRQCMRYLDVPLVAVTARPEAAVETQYLAAGASVVCPASAPPARIHEELRARCHLQPVLARIRATLLNPFISAMQVTLQQMAGIEGVIRGVYQKCEYRMLGDVSAVIGLLGQVEGTMVLSCSDEAATALTRRILQGFEDEPDEEMVKDCVGELANIVAGQTRGALAETPHAFAISTPTVVSGAGHEIRHKPGMPCLVVAFGTPEGDFALQLCMAMEAPVRAEGDEA